ncbi:hypothetical protein Tco_0851202 [Tanacetum coccineum]
MAVNPPQTLLLPGAAESESGSGANVNGEMAQVFHVQSGLLREQFAGLVIQRGLPFNQFWPYRADKRVFQNIWQTAIHSCHWIGFTNLSKVVDNTKNKTNPESLEDVHVLDGSLRRSYELTKALLIELPLDVWRRCL